MKNTFWEIHFEKYLLERLYIGNLMLCPGDIWWKENTTPATSAAQNTAVFVLYFGICLYKDVCGTFLLLASTQFVITFVWIAIFEDTIGEVWIFGKVPNNLWPPTHFWRKKYCDFFGDTADAEQMSSWTYKQMN